MKVQMKSLSRVRLFATPWTVPYQAPLPMGFSRQEYWSGLPVPSAEDLPKPGIEPWSPTLQTDALLSELPGNICIMNYLVTVSITSVTLHMVQSSSLSSEICPILSGKIFQEIQNYVQGTKNQVSVTVSTDLALASWFQYMGFCFFPRF